MCLAVLVRGVHPASVQCRAFFKNLCTQYQKRSMEEDTALCDFFCKHPLVDSWSLVDIPSSSCLGNPLDYHDSETEDPNADSWNKLTMDHLIDPNKIIIAWRGKQNPKASKACREDTREDKGKPALFIDTQGNQVMVDKMQLNIIRTIREEERSKTTSQRTNRQENQHQNRKSGNN